MSETITLGRVAIACKIAWRVGVREKFLGEKILAGEIYPWMPKS